MIEVCFRKDINLQSNDITFEYYYPLWVYSKQWVYHHQSPPAYESLSRTCRQFHFSISVPKRHETKYLSGESNGDIKVGTWSTLDSILTSPDCPSVVHCCVTESLSAGTGWLVGSYSLSCDNIPGYMISNHHRHRLEIGRQTGRDRKAKGVPIIGKWMSLGDQPPAVW